MRTAAASRITRTIHGTPGSAADPMPAAVAMWRATAFVFAATLGLPSLVIPPSWGAHGPLSRFAYLASPDTLTAGSIEPPASTRQNWRAASSARPTRLPDVLDRDAVLAEIDDVFARCGATADNPRVPTTPPPRGVIGDSRVVGNGAAMASSILAAVERNAPQRSYIEQARKYAEKAVTATPVNNMLGVLLGVRQDIEAGYVRTIEDRVRDDLSGDLLETADSIVKLNAAPAIVLAISVLEEHVRKMADARNIAIVKADGKHRSFEDMIADLQREDAIASTEKRTASAWYAQRTEAAHGRFENVIGDDAPRIISGVRDFIVRHPH